MFYGWWIVILIFFSSALGGATIWYGFTAFFDPLVKEFSWSYTAISFAASLRTVEVGLMDIAVGFLLDRFSVRRIVFLMSLLVAIGFFMLSRVNSLMTFYISYVIISCGGTAFSALVSVTIVSRWFSKRLGLATGIAMAGFGTGGFAVPVIVYLLELMDFRTVFVVFSIAALVMGSILAFFLRNRPEDLGYGPDGVPLERVATKSEVASGPGSNVASVARDPTFKEAISQLPFWTITYLSIATVFAIQMVTTHVMPYLQHLNYSRYTASMVAMMIPVLSIIGRLGIGWVSDYVNRKLMFLLTTVGQIAGMLLFLYARQPSLLIPFALLFGISYGGILTLRPAALRDYYGRTYIGSIMGFCLGLGVTGGVFGPLVAGWVFDTTRNYNLAWIIGAASLLIGIPLLLLTKNPPSAMKRHP